MPNTEAKNNPQDQHMTKYRSKLKEINQTIEKMPIPMATIVTLKNE